MNDNFLDLVAKVDALLAMANEAQGLCESVNEGLHFIRREIIQEKKQQEQSKRSIDADQICAQIR